MKHYIDCCECEKENPNSISWAVGEINSDLVALCVCPKGHKTVSGLMHNLFDVLYSSAVDSFIKECYSESVMSFAASLERTYEMFIKVILKHDGIPFNKIEEFWKEIKTHSERQYGAFCVQFLKATGEEWRLDQKQVRFRNNVIHQGYIATSREVKYYAEYITENLVRILKILHDDYSIESRDLYIYQKGKVHGAIKKMMEENNAKVISTSHPSLLKWNYGEMVDVNFENALKTMKDRNKILGKIDID